MRHLLLTLALAGLLGFAVVGCSKNGGCCGAGGTCCATPSAGCECGLGMDGKDGWCNDCGVGYVDGKKVECKGCYIAKTGGPACPKCSG